MKRRYFFIVILAAALLLTAGGLYAFQQPPIVTITPAVPSTVYVNSTTTVTISAQITDSRVIPTGVNLLQVDPITGARQVAGTLASQGGGMFSITIQPNTSAPQLFSYEVSAPFRGLLKRSISLPITVAVAPIGVVLPPDPGPVGMATLAGVDSDGDGVRDDVQRWIAITYYSSTSTRAALTQAANAIDAFLLDNQDQTLAIEDSNAMKAASDCLSYIQPTHYSSEVAQLEAQVLNTPGRSSAYIASNKQLNGVFYSLPSNDQERIGQCAFDVSSLPN